jgi:hypothetical protein
VQDGGTGLGWRLPQCKSAPSSRAFFNTTLTASLLWTRPLIKAPSGHDRVTPLNYSARHSILEGIGTVGCSDFVFSIFSNFSFLHFWKSEIREEIVS